MVVQLTRFEAAGMAGVARGQRGSLDQMRLAYDAISALSLDTSGWVRVFEGREIYDLAVAAELVDVTLPLAQAAWLLDALRGWSQYSPGDIEQWAVSGIGRLETHVAALRAA